MSVLCIAEGTIKPGDVSNFKALMAEILPDSRAYDGCQAFDVYFNTEDENEAVVVEQWDSRQHHEKYLAWRAETGVLDKIVAMLTGPPTFRYLEKFDA